MAIAQRGRVRLIDLSPFASRGKLGRLAFRALDRAIQAADADPGVGAIVIAGLGAFLSGRHISGPRDGEPPARYLCVVDGRMFRLLWDLAAIRTPLLAAVDGVAAGISATLTLNCDMVFASPAAQFHFPCLDLGMVLQPSLEVSPPLQAGHLAMANLLLTGRTMAAREADGVGVVTHLVTGRAVLEAALEEAAAIAAKPQEATRAALALLKSARRKEIIASIGRDHHRVDRLVRRADIASAVDHVTVH